ITHRVVGPAYKMKSLFREVANGHLKVASRLRHGDELQDVFAEFEKMIEALRDNQRREIAELNSIIQRAKDANVPADVVGDLERLKDKMEKALD
ncbi:MAG: HAMP domain-containing protein, partial [Deltaproteobacteria bacterium]|nr:HAMP domain-containing protein [Deltaproteobacteria bacterium]